MIIEFDHSVHNFNPDGVLLAAGADPVGSMYYYLIREVTSIIETRALIVAERLNGFLKQAYFQDMMSISEYARYPYYYDVMEHALSQKHHIGYYWDKIGKIQAKFVDVPALGDTNDLIDIQKLVHPGGTLEGWKIIYNAWRGLLIGNEKKYEQIVDSRLALMRGAGIAPFCEIIENGNGHNAYPHHHPRRTLTNFAPTYDMQMKATFLSVVSDVRALLAKPTSLFADYRIDSVVHNEKTNIGYSWTSTKGQTIFSISGTTKIDGLGRLTGRGFILDSSGVVLKKWGGFLPR